MAQLNISQGRLLKKIIDEEFHRIYNEARDRYYREVDAEREEVNTKVDQINARFEKRWQSLREAIQAAVEKEGLAYTGDAMLRKAVLPINGHWRLKDKRKSFSDIADRIHEERLHAIRRVHLAQLTDTDAKDFLDSIPTVDSFF